MDNKKMTLTTVVVFVLAIIVFGVTVFTVFFRPDQENAAKAQAMSNRKTQNIEVGDITTQIGSTGKYYKGFVYLEVTGKKTSAKAEKKMPQIKDKILGVISSSDAKSLSGTMDSVKSEIATEVDAILGEGSVVDVLFTESIVQ